MAADWLRVAGAGLTLMAGLMIGGCTTMKIEDYAGKQPAMVPEEYFLGQTRGWGMFHDRFGNLRLQFVVDMVGEMQGDVFVLTENFVYDDGEKEQRIWHITPLENGVYRGTAGDVVGTAEGKTAGNAFNWIYELKLKVGGSIWKVAFDDWLYLQSDGVILNRATATRWGFEIGTLTATFQKQGLSQASLPAQTQSVIQAAE